MIGPERLFLRSQRTAPAPVHCQTCSNSNAPRTLLLYLYRPLKIAHLTQPNMARVTGNHHQSCYSSIYNSTHKIHLARPNWLLSEIINPIYLIWPRTDLIDRILPPTPPGCLGSRSSVESKRCYFSAEPEHPKKSGI